MMIVWNNLADPHLSAFSHFAWFSQTVTLKPQGTKLSRTGGRRQCKTTLAIVHHFDGQGNKLF